MSTTETQPLRAGRVGPHRESHEPRLMATDFLAPGVTPISGYLEYDGTKGIGDDDWGMDNNGPDPTNPPFMPDGAGCCGFAGKDHVDVAKMGDKTMAGLSFSPRYPTLLDAYWAYGISQGEEGPHPDLGVDNANFMAWLYTTGEIYGYAEVPDEFADWFTKTFTAIVLGLSIDANVASDDFNKSPRIWDEMALLDGHDTAGVKCHADGSGGLVSWGGLVLYTLAFRLKNITDRWVIWDKDDPYVNHDALQGALLAVHGVIPTQVPAVQPTADELAAAGLDTPIVSVTTGAVDSMLHAAESKSKEVQKFVFGGVESEWSQLVAKLEGLKNWAKDREELHKLATSAIEGESVNLLIAELGTLVARFGL